MAVPALAMAEDSMMKAITRKQPEPSLVMEGIQTMITVAREHPWRSAIGQTIAIHAGARRPDEITLGEWRAGYSWRTNTPMLYGPLFFALPLGAVLGTCTLTAVVPIIGRDDGEGGHEHFVRNVNPNDWPEGGDLALRRGFGEYVDIADQRPFGDFSPGRYALLLDDVQKFDEPIPTRGHQGLWEWTK